ncbi:spore-associated protein [Streptomyces sp. NPDC056121]|uniref:spore-associated protein n=1 Tax=Streptomyces TaxID=1883 RepID=UPI000C27E5C5|nr:MULTISPECIES: spore-associated protein [Streptomyces]MCX5084365.1 spore-associated protein [Streptomyces sp. NBC_00401]PJN11945.1 spore-associated protein [Streptomyces sp. CB01635]UDM04316.1 spore-associated protein [Streptomyces longhuiensis]
MRFSRPVLTGAALAALALGGTTALAGPASATPNTTPQKVCGSSYKTVNSAPIGSLGTVYLTYNSTNGKNCVATIRKNPGTRLDMSAWIYVSDTDQGDQDYGQYTSYAGPIYVYGKGHCVDWGGNISNVYVQVTGSNCAALREHRVTTTR